MNILKRFKKLSKMPPAEMIGRTAQLFRRQAERVSYLVGKTPRWNEDQLTQLARGLVQRTQRLIRGTKSSHLDRCRLDFPDMYEKLQLGIKDRLTRLSGTSWTLFEQPVDLTSPIDWHRDPRTGYRWPKTFYSKVKLYDVGDGIDVKYVWELNRQQYVVDLALGWCLLREEQYAARAKSIILDWIDNNPMYQGVNWASSLEVAVRSISWIWVLAGLAEWPGWKQKDLKRIANSLAEHAKYLERHLSYYSSPYNHIIGEATALFLLGRTLRGLEDASRWEQRGLSVLLSYGPRQFHPDGFCVEQASNYHFFTLGFLMQAVLAGRAYERPLAELEPVVSRAMEAGAALHQPDGRWPPIGDLDSARSIPILHDDFWDFRSLCSLGAILFKLPKLKSITREPGEELYWLTGCDGLEDWQNLSSEPPASTTVLAGSGYAIARSEANERADWLLFDAGPLSEGLYHDSTPSVAHGHADILSLLLFQEGKPVLVDSGIPDYAGSRQWVDHFRSAAAHNTIEVDGLPIARTAGRLAWSNVCCRPRLEANLSAAVWLLRGLVDLDCGSSVERNVLGLPGRGVWVADVVRCDKPRMVKWHWHLPQSASSSIIQTNDFQRQVRFEQGTLAAWTDQENLDIRLESATESSPVAWLSQAYGSRTPGYRVTYEASCSGELLVLTFVGPQWAPSAVKIRREQRTLSSNSSILSNDSFDFPTEQKLPEAEIVWWIGSESSLVAYAAGLVKQPVVPGWVSLSGTGDWPAASFSHEMTPVK